MIMQLKQVLRAARDKTLDLVYRDYVRCARRSGEPLGLSPEAMVLAYTQGLFPLGRPSGRVDWQSLDERGVIATDAVHVSKRLKTYLRKNTLEVRYNERFGDVLIGCADREETWINEPLAGAYQRLHAAGIAHSVEAYLGGELVGGGFGLAIGSVFFLESMYCTADHASKIAFVRLAERLARSGFDWIDCQYLSEHWKRFGAQPIARVELVKRVVAGLNCGTRLASTEPSDEVHAAATPIVTLPLNTSAPCPVFGDSC